MDEDEMSCRVCSISLILEPDYYYIAYGSYRLGTQHEIYYCKSCWDKLDIEEKCYTLAMMGETK